MPGSATVPKSNAELMFDSWGESSLWCRYDGRPAMDCKSDKVDSDGRSMVDDTKEADVRSIVVEMRVSASIGTSSFEPMSHERSMSSSKVFLSIGKLKGSPSMATCKSILKNHCNLLLLLTI